MSQPVIAPFFPPTGYYLLHIIYVPVVHPTSSCFLYNFPLYKSARTDPQSW